MGLWQVRQHLPTPKELASVVQAELTNALGVPVRLQGAEASLTGATLWGLRILPDKRSPTGYLLTVPQMRLRWSVKELLSPPGWRRFVQAQLERSLNQVVISDAMLFLWRDPSGQWNAQPLLREVSRRPRRQVIPMRFHDSELIIGDETLPLPDGTPLRLHLTAVRGELRPVDGGSALSVQGNLQPPLGIKGSKATLTLTEIAGESVSERQGTLSLTKVPIASLPQKAQRFFGDRLSLDGGIVTDGELQWQQSDDTVSLTVTLTGRHIKATWHDGQVKPFRPADVSVNIALNMEGMSVRSWRVWARLLQRHPQLGSGQWMAEGDKDRWQFRWHGENLPVATLKGFADVPLRRGILSGTVAVEKQQQRLRVDADVVVRQGQIALPKGVAKEWRLPSITVQWAQMKAQVELIGKGWHGYLTLKAQNDPTHLTATAWLEGEGGRAQVRANDFPLPIPSVNTALARFIGTGLKPAPTVRIRKGFVSGEAKIAWQGRKWRLESAKAIVHEGIMEGEGLPPMNFSASLNAQKQTLTLSRAQIRWEDGAWVIGSGSTTLDKQPMWQAQGQLNPGALKRLMAWAQNRFELPLHLLQGGKMELKGGGVGKQWNALAVWDEPTALFALRGERWQTQLNRLTLLAAPKGGIAVAYAAQTKALSPRIRLGKIVLGLPDTVKLGEWRLVWDAQRQAVTAYGRVALTHLTIGKLTVRDLQGIAEVKAAASPYAPSVHLQLRDIHAQAFNGHLRGGWFTLRQQEAQNGDWELTAELTVDGIALRELEALPVSLPIALDGELSGKLNLNGSASVQGKRRASVQGTLNGEVREFEIQATNFNLGAKKMSLVACGVRLEADEKGWQIRSVGADGIGQNLTLAFNGQRRLRMQKVQVQGIAERTANGWKWDGRLPYAQMLGGRWSGQGSGDHRQAQGHLSFADTDAESIAELAWEWGLIAQKELPKGKISGWLKWTGVKRDGSQKGRNGERGKRWDGEWESGITVADGKWRDWTVKLVGMRLRGTLTADGRGKDVRVIGEADGLHFLSDDGQAVLSGQFVWDNSALRTSHSALKLVGRWGAVSLRRIAERFGLPKPLRGIAEGTVQIRWNGAWQVNGTAQSEAIAISETVLEKVKGTWAWEGSTVRLTDWQATLSESLLTCQGVVGTAAPYPLTLTLRGDGVALTELMALLREWQMPFSHWQWRGKTEGTIHVSRNGDGWQLTAALIGQRVSLGDVPLGMTRLDLKVVRANASKQQPSVTKAQGQVSIQSNGMTVMAKFDGTLPFWQVRWRGGKVALSIVKAFSRQLLEGSHQAVEENRQAEWERWLALPLRGEIWTEGKAEGEGGRITAMKASAFAPQLRGIGGEPINLRLNIARDKQGWRIQIAQLQQRSATASGWVLFGDDGTLQGQWQTQGVRKRNLVGALQSLGVQAGEMPLPEGTVNATVQLSGTREHPQVTGKLSAEDVRWLGWRLPELAVHRFTLKDGVLRLDKGDAQVRWDGNIPPALLWGTLTLNGERKLGVWLELPRVPVTALLPDEVNLRVRNGWLQGRWQLEGTLNQPRLSGTLTGEAEEISGFLNEEAPPPMTALTNLRKVRWRLFAEGTTVRLEELSAQFSGGTLTGKGFLTLGEGGLQNLFANDGELTLRLQNAQMAWSGTSVSIADLRLTAEVQRDGLLLRLERLDGKGIKGQGQVRWAKDFWVQNGKSKEPVTNGWRWFTEGIWDLALQLDGFRWQVKGAQGQLSGRLTFRTVREGEQPLLSGDLTVHDGTVAQLSFGGVAGERQWQLPTAVQFAVKAYIGENFFLRNPQVAVLLDGEAHIMGNLAQPRMDGQVRSRRGTLRLPASVLTLTEMEFHFAYAVDPLTQQWQGTARLRMEGETQLDVHRILFTVSGPVDERSQRLGILPTVTMLATPPLPEKTMLERMFGLGLAQLGEALTDWQQLFSGTMVRGFMGDLLAPVTSPIAEALRLTELNIIREQTTGRHWLRLGIPLSPRLHVLWRQGLSPSDPSALEVQYFLGKRTSVTWSKRERERAEIRLQTSFRF